MHRSLPGLTRRGDQTRALQATLAEEVPVAMVHDGTTLAVMMASPGDLADFAHGFALSERVVEDLAGIDSFEIHDTPAGIELRMWLADAPEAKAAKRPWGGCGMEVTSTGTALFAVL